MSDMGLLLEEKGLPSGYCLQVTFPFVPIVFMSDDVADVEVVLVVAISLFLLSPL
jgi:hypothetical protein